MNVLEILLALLMVVGFPMLDHVRLGALKRQSSHRTRMGVYRYIVVALWGALAVAALVTFLNAHRDPFFLHPQPDEVLTFAGSHHLDTAFLTGMGAAFAVGLLMPVVLGWASAKALVKIRAAFASLGFLLPQGPVERLTFAAVALTAGICEEILYRGFLLHVFHADLHLPVLWAAGVAVAAFGIAHSYQGAKGILATTVLGAVFMGLYLLTRTLIPCMLLHTLIDLRPLLLLPREGTPFDDPAISY